MTRRIAENAFDFSRFGVGRSLLNLARLAASAYCWELSYCDFQRSAPMLAGLVGHSGPSPGADGLPPPLGHGLGLGCSSSAPWFVVGCHHEQVRSRQ